MAVRRMYSIWTSTITICFLYLLIKDVDCSECTDLAGLLDTKSVSPCQSTTTHVTGSSVVFDFYDSNNLAVDSCSCAVTIPSTMDFRLSMSAYQGLGINSNSGCGSKIEVNSSQSGTLTMECRVFGSILMQTGENAAVKLTREQNVDSRYCMLMSTDPSFIMDINCEAVGSAPLPTTTTTTTSATTPTTTTPTTTTPTTTTPTTTTPTTTTTTPTTTTPTTTTPTTTTPTTTTPITTTPTTTTPTTTTPTTTTPTTTTPTTTTTTPTTTATTTPAVTSQTVKTTTKPATTTKPTTTTTKPPITTTKALTNSSPTSSQSVPPPSTPTSSPTTTTAAGDTRVRGQNEDSSDKNLIIIIPVVVGLFLLLMVLLVVTQLARAYRQKKQSLEPDTEKFRFGQTFPKHSFLHTSDMVETTHYDSNEDLHGHTDRYVSVTNPVYMHDEAEYLPDLTDQEVAKFTSIHNSESEKIISRSTGKGTEADSEAPLYAVVNKTNINNSLDFSKMSDHSSKTSSEFSGLGMLEENERNLRQEESFYY